MGVVISVITTRARHAYDNDDSKNQFSVLL